MTVLCRWIGGLLFALSLASAATVESSAETKSPAIELPFRASAGDRFSVKVSTATRKTSGGQETYHKSTTITYDGHIQVADPNGYVISWTEKSGERKILADRDGTAAKEVKIAEELAKGFKDLPIVFEATKTGTPVRIRNWWPMAKHMAEFMRENLTRDQRALLASKGTNKSAQELDTIAASQVEQIIQMLILRHDDRSAVVYLEDAIVVGNMQHRAWQRDKAFEEEVAAPNPFSDAGIPAKNRLTLLRYDKSASEAEVVWTSQYDPPAIKSAAMAVTEAQLKAANAPAEQVEEARKAIDSTTTTRADEIRALISIKDGWARRIEVKKTVVSESPNQPKYEDVRTRLIEITRRRR